MPVDPSVLQSEASRRNGALGEGPVTAEGKARAALNAAGHGLCAESFILRPQERERLAQLEAALVLRHRPRDAAMVQLVTELARNAMLRMRLGDLEMLALTAAVDGGVMTPGEPAATARPRLPSLATLCRYRARLEHSERHLLERLAELAEPDQAQAEPPARPASPPRRNEPEAASPAPATQPLNRHERRRLEAMERKTARAA